MENMIQIWRGIFFTKIIEGNPGKKKESPNVSLPKLRKGQILSSKQNRTEQNRTKQEHVEFDNV